MTLFHSIRFLRVRKGAIYAEFAVTVLVLMFIFIGTSQIGSAFVNEERETRGIRAGLDMLVAVDGDAVRINFANTPPVSFLPGSQDSGDFVVEDEGRTLVQESQSWEGIPGPFEIGPDTHLRFDFESTSRGDIHGVMFSNSTTTLTPAFAYRFFGWQLWGTTFFPLYTPAEGLRSYDVAIGENFTGTFDRIVILTDDDVGAGANSTWSNLRLEVPFGEDQAIDIGQRMANIIGFAGDEDFEIVFTKVETPAPGAAPVIAFSQSFGTETTNTSRVGILGSQVLVDEEPFALLDDEALFVVEVFRSRQGLFSSSSDRFYAKGLVFEFDPNQAP